MPVDFQEYAEKADLDGLQLGADTNAVQILRFLADDPEQGFRPAEIADRTGIPPGSVRGTLSRLEDRGLVRHAAPYWAIGHDDRLAGAAGTLLGLKAVGERYPDDEFEGWDEHAVDPREHREE